MHGYDRLAAFGYRFLNQCHVHGVRLGVNVHQHRSGPAHLHGGDRSHCRVGNGDHFIAGADPQGPQGKVNSLCSVSHAHGKGNADVVGELPFKGGSLVAKNVAAGAEHPTDHFVEGWLIEQVIREGACLRDHR